MIMTDINSANTDLEISCRCGVVNGVLKNPKKHKGDHIVCHCTDCQTFARRLGAQEHVLDKNGGTALFQSRCAAMQISGGREHLGCFHLTEKPTLRWYARCCSTPMFNSYANGRVPYITTIVANCDATHRERFLGPVKGHLFTHEATGDVRGLPKMSMAKLMRRFFVRMVADTLSGDRRRSALFDPVTLEPVIKPENISSQSGS